MHHHSTPNLMMNNNNNSNNHSSSNHMSSGSGGGVTSSSSVHDTLASIVVPGELKTLIRIIMRVFYSFESYLCIEMLLIYPCLKEEDLAELLRLDVKTVHQFLVNLKKEKFLNEKSIMETSVDGKQSKHSYFYINYKMLVNVIKYKLDRIRIQIESDENQSTTRPQFKCSECGKTYSDLDTKDIFLTMRCTLCNAEVEEDTSALPKQSSRNLMNKFNTQMTPIFDLLSRVEHIRLADSVLRPEPVDMSYVLERMKASSSSAGAAGQNGVNKPGANGLNGKSGMNKFGNADRWSGDKTRNTDLFSKTQIMINLDAGGDAAGGAAAGGKRATKELPSIIVQNRVRDEELDSRDSILLNSVRQAADETMKNSTTTTTPSTTTSTATSTSTSSTAAGGQLTTPTSATASTPSGPGGIDSQTASGTLTSQQQSQNLELVIMQKLLKHEKKATGSSSSADSPAADSSSTSNSPKTATDPVSSITITKKRPMDTSSSTTGNNNNNKVDVSKSNGLNNLHENDLYAAKKRKLNNGEIVNGSNHHHVSSVFLKRNHSDGSGSENSSETGADDYHYYQRAISSGLDEDDYYRDQEMALYDDDYHQRQHYTDYHDDYHHTDGIEDEYIPRVYVQSRPIRFDRVTPRLIKLMSVDERDDYINICKQLYTEIYEFLPPQK